MTGQVKYNIYNTLNQICLSQNIDAKRVLHAADMSERLQDAQDQVTEPEFFALWEALVSEAQDPAFPVKLAHIFAHGPFTPALLAFSCSITIADGLHRQSIFKPLMGPISYKVVEAAEGLNIFIKPAMSLGNIPDSLAIFEMVFLTECCRVCTTKPVTPIAAKIPGHAPSIPAAETYFGTAIDAAPEPQITLSRSDAELHLISENSQIWQIFEPELRRRLEQQQSEARLSVRVRDLLIELLPAGDATFKTVCERMNMSPRTLQRRLKSEDTSFKEILNETRMELALHYIKMTDVSNEEISYLLGFSDPASFYRSINNWSGKTPGDLRNEINNLYKYSS